MNNDVLGYVFSAVMVVVGIWFAMHERRNAASLADVPEVRRPFVVTRTRRRIRIATLFIFIGLLSACAGATEPRHHPIRYLIIWSTVTFFALALLGYGVADAYAAKAGPRQPPP
jgi:hypothetical protein